MPARSESLTWTVAYALLYALALTTLVIFSPSGDHVSIYQGF